MSYLYQQQGKARQMDKKTQRFFANAELKDFKIALKREFPNAQFKSEFLGYAPNGKPAWEVIGYGEVRIMEMEELEAKMQFRYAFVNTITKTYQLI